MALLIQSKASLDSQLPLLEHDTSSCRQEITNVSTILLQLGALLEEKTQVLRDLEVSVDKFNPLPVLLQHSTGGSAGNDASDALAHELKFFEEHFVAKVEAICADEQSKLGELATANKAFEAKRATDSVMQDRQAYLQRLSDAVDVFEQLQSHLKEGAKFYEDLRARIQQLRQTVDDHCAARELERRETELNVAADIEMKKREERDAAVAQQMMRDMQISSHTLANDEAMARQLAGGTPQQFTSSPSTMYPQQSSFQQGGAGNGSHAHPQQMQPSSQFSYGANGSTPGHPYAVYQQSQGANAPNGPPPPYSSIFSSSPSAPPQFGNYYAQQQQQQQQSYPSYYQYPGAAYGQQQPPNPPPGYQGSGSSV
ncbi:hypothetical protein PINS_up010183 [Pythium insidiosum]|nr:hypothetical protein PINS_up010183 [Pythium insidiosum]